MPIQAALPAEIAHPAKLPSIHPRGSDVRDANGIVGSVDLNEGRLLVVCLTDGEVFEPARRDVGAGAIPDQLLVLVVETNLGDGSIGAGGMAGILSVDGNGYANRGGVCGCVGWE